MISLLKVHWVCIFACAPLAITTLDAYGSLQNNPAAFGTSTVVDFSQLNGSGAPLSGTLQVGGLVGESIEASAPGRGVSYGNGRFGLGNNGFWNSGRNGYLGAAYASITLQFNDGPVASAGAFLNYVQGSDFIISALDSSGNILESYNVDTLAPISTPGQEDGGAFRGIQRTTSDIAALRFGGTFYVIDDLTFSRIPVDAEVPEPLSAAIWGGIALTSGVLGFRSRNYAPRASRFSDCHVN